MKPLNKLTILSVFSVLSVVIFLSGCANLRHAPTESQKAEAVIHQNTTAAIVEKYAAAPAADPNLFALMQLADMQAGNILAYYGLPAKSVDPAFLAELKAAKPAAITAAAEISKQSAADAVKRPTDWWAALDGLFGLFIAVATIVGGAGGVKFVSWISLLLNKSKALREVVEANEAVKAKAGSDSNKIFKSIQKLVQSDSTVAIIDSIRKELAVRDAAKN